jgi:diguanylate cyclase (GGDEF)-like protein
MLWNRRKASEPSVRQAPVEDRASLRPADADRALDAVGTLLKSYGRFAFDTEHAASAIREQCEHWASRILLGEVRRDDAALRDWPGLQRFFDDQRRLESDYVTRTLGGLRGTVLALARCLGGGAGEDRESDAEVERGLEALSRALTKADMPGVSRAATAVIETTRASMGKRRTREARHVAELGERLRELREDLSNGLRNAIVDPLTGLLGRAAYEQQLEQLSALGGLLEQQPWLAVIEVAKGGARAGALDDAALTEVSKVMSRTFLRKQDFMARSGTKEFAVLLADMTQEQIVTAFERLLAGVRKLAENRRRADAPSVSIGLACLRANEEPADWRARADVALERAKEDGGDGYQISR